MTGETIATSTRLLAAAVLNARRDLAVALKKLGRDWSVWLPALIVFAGVLLAFEECIDLNIALAAKGLSPEIRSAFSIINRLALGGIWIPLAAVAWLVLKFVRRNDERAGEAAFIFYSLVMAGLLSTTLKMFFGRARPHQFFTDGIYSFDFFHVQAAWLSFPSGHVTTMAALTAALFFLRSRAWLVAALLSVAVFVGRVVVNAHYPSDVMAGAACGVLGAFIILEAFRVRMPEFPLQPICRNKQSSGTTDI